uniref:Peroxisomal ATPase PEX6 n=1 Tax=Haplochromis burtoni TaxID=8153 RepID=A0A3Q2VI76_HAPBU
MAVQVELSYLETFPSHLSPLDVLMLKPHLDRVFLNDTDPPTVLFTPQGPQSSGRTGILLRVHQTTEEETADGVTCPTANTESAPRVRLFASRLFLRHHGLQQFRGTGTVRAVEPVSLDRVVVGARSRQSLRLAGSEQFTDRLLELCRPGHWLLARQGDPLLLPRHTILGEDPGQLLELLVLECSPVKQGRITADTSLVLTDCWDSVTPPPCRPLRLCVSDFAHYADGLCAGPCLLDNRSVLDSGFPGVSCPLLCRVEVRVMDTQRWLELKEQYGVAVDLHSCVFVTKQLLLRLGLFNQEWVRLSKLGESRGPTGEGDVTGGICRERLVSVVVMDLPPRPSRCEAKKKKGFIPSANLQCLFFWFLSLVWSQRWDPPPLQPSGCRSDTFCRSASPPYASELHIQLVTSPSYNNLGCYDNLLAQHFCTPRLVSPGDVLTVPAGNHPDLLETPSEGIHRCPVLFFRVQKVCSSAGREEGGGAYLASRQRTSLYMVNSDRLPQSFFFISFPLSPHRHHPASPVDCVSLCADSPAASEVKLASVFQRAEALQPCVLLLRNLQLVLRSRGAAESDCRVQAKLCQLLSCAPTSVVMVATVCKVRDLSAGIMAAFVHQVAIESPTEEQRRAMLSSLSRDLHLGKDVNLENLSRLTTGFVLGDLSALLVEAGRAAYRRLIHSCGARQQEDLCSSGVTILNQDFTSALEILQDTLSKAIGAPKIPNVRWEDVGGLQHVKKEILDTVQLPLQCPQLLSLDLNRTGILLCGPPGTGKTLLAKAVATECSMTFLSVKGPELINMYVGQSEENIREVFHRARSAAPCVIFFDELDSLAPSRGRSGDSGGVMDRFVSQLLAELDALHSSGGVFVIGATNRPDLLDQSLLRPGRFDKLVYMGINEDRVSQLQVFQAILRKFQLDPAVNLQEVVDCCPAHMTGADLYALCSDATMAAIKRKISLISDGLDSEDSPVLLSTEDFSTALENFKSSVSDEELLRYKDIQQKLAAK